MQAVVKTAPGPGLKVQKVAMPSPGQGQVLLKVAACGICASDRAIYLWEEHMRRHMENALPVIIGHEMTGEVVAVGEGVASVKPKTRVAVEPNLPCWECGYCIQGQTNLCRQKKTILGVTVNGGMAEYAVVPASNVFPVPDGISDVEAPLLETLGVGVHAMERAPVSPGQSVVVVGAGPVGLLLMQAVKAVGASLVVVTGSARSSARLRLAKTLGADVTLASDDKTVARVKELTDGLGADVVFEAAGTSAAVGQALQMVRPGGRVCLVGSSEEAVPVHPWSMIKTPEVTVIGSHARRLATWPTILALAAGGKVRLGPLVSETVPLSRAVDAIRRVQADRAVIKVIVTP